VKNVAYFSNLNPDSLHFISADNSCLLNSKLHFQKNYLVHSMIDFSVNNEKMFTRLSDSMLKLGKNSRIPTFFGISYVNSVGEVNYTTKSLNLDLDLEIVKKEITLFIKQYKCNSVFNFGKLN
jgi:hypothetical protein